MGNEAMTRPSPSTVTDEGLVDNVLAAVLAHTEAGPRETLTVDVTEAKRAIRDVLEASSHTALLREIEGLLEKHIQRCRDAVVECQKWSPAQAEWSRARDALLNFKDDLAALSRL